MWLLCGALLLIGYGTNISSPLLIVYRDRLSLSNSETMAIFTVYVFGIMSTLLVAGPASDRYGRRIVVIPFTMLSGVASLVLIAGQNSFWLMLLGRYLLGATSGAALGTGTAWMQELAGKGNEQRTALLATIVTYFGFGVGPITSAFFHTIDVNPLTWPYVMHAAITFAALPVLLRVPETIAIHDPAVRARSLRPQLGVPQKAKRLFWLMVVPAAMWIFAFPSTSFALFPVIVSDSIPDLGVVVAAGSAAATAWSALLARPIVGRLGTRRALPAGVLLGVTGYVLGTTAFSLEVAWWVIPAAVALGASSGTITASSLGILSEVAEPSKRGTINSTLFLIAYPGMVMPIALTTIARWVDLTTALQGATLLALAVLVWSTAMYQLERRARAVGGQPHLNG